MSKPPVEEQTQQIAPVKQPDQPRDAAVLMDIISRAAGDTNYDLDRMDRLFAMYQAMQKRDEERLFDEAMAIAQATMKSVAADKDNSQTRSKYASYAALDGAIRPIYTEQGFSLSFRTMPVLTENFINLVCRISHKGGASRDVELLIPADGKGAKGGDVMTKTHAIGSAITYGMRYLLKMIFNLAVGDSEDDDGNRAGGQNDSAITSSQAELIRQKLISTGADLTKFLAFFKVESVVDLRASQFRTAMNLLKAKSSG